MVVAGADGADSSTSSSSIASCSIPTMYSPTRPRNQRCAISAGIATIMPAAVDTSALPMPPASWFTSPMPWSRMPRNIWIMPTTVPNRPNSGPEAEIVPSVLR